MRQETSRTRRAVTDAEAEAQPDSRPDPSESVAGREQREHIESSLAELGPERERAVRAHLAGFAVQEIMEMHTWSYQKARNLIARGMQDLRTSEAMCATRTERGRGAPASERVRGDAAGTKSPRLTK